MWAIATDVVAWSVCVSVCAFVSHAKMAEKIEMPFRGLARVGPRNHVLDEGPDAQGEGAILGV